jgi:hypothetical protein
MTDPGGRSDARAAVDEKPAKAIVKQVHEPGGGTRAAWLPMRELAVLGARWLSDVMRSPDPGAGSRSLKPLAH